MSPSRPTQIPFHVSCLQYVTLGGTALRVPLFTTTNSHKTIVYFYDSKDIFIINIIMNFHICIYIYTFSKDEI